jgi:hypothetical protein
MFPAQPYTVEQSDHFTIKIEKICRRNFMFYYGVHITTEGENKTNFAEKEYRKL